MSNISTIYDALITRVSAVLPNHNRLPLNTNIDLNMESRLRQGWGLSFAAGAINTNRVMAGNGGKMSVDRSFLLSITRQEFVQDQNASGRATAEKQLLEDQFLVIEDLEKDPKLGTSICINARYVSDNGLEFVFPDERKYIMIVSTINVEYFEDLS